MIPPLPDPGAVPVVLLKMPPGVPSVLVPAIEIWLALTVISPPLPVLAVLLSICAPWVRLREPVVMEMGAASPQSPVQNWPPFVRE